MATVAGVSIGEADSTPPGSGARLAGAIDKWIYVFMAALFVVTTLVGFIPDSLMKIAMVEAGTRPPFPPALHVHAVLMGAWLMLLLAQTSLMATGRSGYHQKLGIASMVLAPAIVVTGIVLVPTMYHASWNAVQNPPPGMADAVRNQLAFSNNIMLVQFRIALLFPVLVVFALRARRRDSGLHKRLIILATLMPLPAAIDRIAWLPTKLPASPLSIDLYPLLWISPMFIWDLFRLGRIHRAYVIWFAVSLPFAVATNLLWGTPFWTQLAPRLMGVG